VISGPSGVGKGSVVRRLLEEDPDRLWYSVSVSTRAPRPGESPSLDYWFVTEEEFDARLARGEFLEWAEVFGHRYGTPVAPMEEAVRRGQDVLLEIDVQGAAKVRARVPDAVLIFLRPPFREELERRLRARGTEDEGSLARRLATVNEELAQAGWFDHLVVNDDLERATGEVAAIIEAYRGDRPHDAKDPST